MLRPVHLRDLLVEPARHPRGQPHLSAASGLVRAGPWLYVVADDEHHLGMFQAGAAEPVRLQRIAPGELPQGKAARKQRKPDLEALTLLPASGQHPHGRLLALGSGSRPNRQQAFAISLDESGMVHGPPAAVDLAGIYQPLRSIFADLNIEGAFVAEGRMQLLHRGNKGDARNACVEYALADWIEWVGGGRSRAPAALRVMHFALGALDGVPWGFTDGAALPGGGWIFSAVAEDTDDSYADGSCVGCAIGCVTADGSLQRMQHLAGAPKVEGIALDGRRRLLMVTDADDPRSASRLLAVDLR